MTLQQLEYLIALDDCRHFVQAAERCFVTQPTLSMQVQKLEEEMGVKLFNRSHKPLKPTRTGEAVIGRARSILNQVSELKGFLEGEKDSLSGEMRLGVIPTLAPYLLPLFLPSFMEQYPLVRLKVFEMQTHAIVEALKNGTLDAGLLVTPLEEGFMKGMPLFEEPFLLYLPDNHPLSENKLISPSQLDPHQLLVLTEGHCFRNQVLNICGDRLNAGTGFNYESGSIETLIRMVDTGMGYTLVPLLAVGGNVAAERIREFTEPRPVREISLVPAPGFHRQKVLEALGGSLRQAVPREMFAAQSKNSIRISLTQQ